jgi:MYXO-CTERM domain-containing protein
MLSLTAALGAMAWTATAAGDLVITEIMYDPAGGNEHEFVEIYNPDAAPVDLSNYLLTTSDRQSTGLSGAIGAFEAVVIVRVDATRTLANYENAWEQASNPDINFLVPEDAWPNYTNAGDGAILYASQADFDADSAEDDPISGERVFDRAVSAVDYRQNGFVSSNDAASIYLTDISADESLGSNWALSQVGVDGAYQGAAPRSSDIGSPGIIPEPGAATALLAGGLLLWRRRRLA